MKGTEKLKPEYYASYRIVRHVGEVTYELELPKGSKIHNVSHVFSLKRTLGQHVGMSTELSLLDEEGGVDSSSRRNSRGKGAKAEEQDYKGVPGEMERSAS